MQTQQGERTHFTLVVWFKQYLFRDNWETKQVLYDTSIIQYKYYTNLACQLHRPDHFEKDEKSNASVGQEFFPNFYAYTLYF